MYSALIGAYALSTLYVTPNKILDSHQNYEKKVERVGGFFLTALMNRTVIKETSNTLKLNCQIEQIKTSFFAKLSRKIARKIVNHFQQFFLL